ncbi:MAG: sulfotransferase family 2 domain-containing protein [Actinomycetota bacterium]
MRTPQHRTAPRASAAHEPTALERPTPTRPRADVPARRHGLRPWRSLDYLGRDLVALRRPRDRNTRRRMLPLTVDGFLLIHVPKTAGTSVSAAFYGPDVFIGHTTARQARRAIGPWAYARLLSFGFVRDPVSRVSSTFRYLRAGGAQNRYDLKWQAALAPYPTLERLVADERMLTELNRNQLHFQPQHRFLCDPAGRLLVREVGRFEHLADDVARIAALAGVDVALPTLNTSSADEDEVRLDRAAVARVRELYARDRALFGYD